jgi:hypothetical protein
VQLCVSKGLELFFASLLLTAQGLVLASLTLNFGACGRVQDIFGDTRDRARDSGKTGKVVNI